MTQSKKRFNLYTISESRNVLFGIATLWIGLFHSWQLTMETYTDNYFLIRSFRFFRSSGNAGVDMFLFLSGIGLYFSFSKDGRILNFWKKRLLRVLPPAFLIAAFYYSMRYVNNQFKSGLYYYLNRMSFTIFLTKGERTFWFVTLILILYVVFPIFYKIIEKFRIFGMLGLVALIVGFAFLVRWKAPGYYQLWEIALCRVPGFVIGIWMGKFVKEKKEISIHWLWLFLTAAIGLSILLLKYLAIMKHYIPEYNKNLERMWIWIYRYEGTLLAICLTILLSYVISSLRRAGQCTAMHNFFEFVGMYSMEYYMIYLNINAYLVRVYKVSERHMVMMYFGSFVVSLVLCVLVRKVCDFFMAYIQRKPKDAPLADDGAKWFGFLIHAGLYALIGVNFYFGSMYLYGKRYVMGAAYMAIVLFAIVTLVLLKKRIYFGTILLYLLIAMDPALYLMRKMLRGSLLDTMLHGGKKAMLFTAVIVGATAAVIVCNIVYFAKRKELFAKKTQ